MLRFLVPTDFSANAQNAMRTALQLARCYSAEVIMMHAMPRPLVPAISPDEVYSSVYETEQTELQEKLRTECQQLYVELGLRTGEVPRQIEVLSTPVSDAILQAIARNSADLVVMGSSGLSGIKRLLFGSNTQEIIGLSPVPVLVVPNQYVFGGFKRITVVIRAKNFGKRTGLDLLARLGRTFSATLYFLVIPEDDGEQAPLLSELLTSRELQEPFRELHHEISTIRKTDKAAALEEHLTKTNTDLLVWLPKRKGLWTESLSEDFAQEVASEAKKPLLIIPHFSDED
ncbi:MAG: universal stress protein [Hymenobacteraceae bacterium]|nr:universal stress protein [Hymenobacteraceae bacterium]